jgi:hypothetical protein
MNLPFRTVFHPQMRVRRASTPRLSHRRIGNFSCSALNIERYCFLCRVSACVCVGVVRRTGERDNQRFSRRTDLHQPTGRRRFQGRRRLVHAAVARNFAALPTARERRVEFSRKRIARHCFAFRDQRVRAAFEFGSNVESEVVSVIARCDVAPRRLDRTVWTGRGGGLTDNRVGRCQRLDSSGMSARRHHGDVLVMEKLREPRGKWDIF